MASNLPYSQSTFEVVDISHSSPSVPTTSSFWLHSMHSADQRYGYDNPAAANHYEPYTNETDNCKVKNQSTIAADTRIWIKTSGGGYAKSVLELSNNFNKNSVFDVPDWNNAVDTESCNYTLGATASIQEGEWSGSIASASHGDIFTIYTVGSDYDPTSSTSSSRFVYVNGVLTKQNYEFDIFQTQSNCLTGHFPPQDLPDEQLLFKRDLYGDKPVRGIMFISQSSTTHLTNRQFLDEQIDWCVENNLGFYYTNLGLGALKPLSPNEWMISGQTTDDATEMLTLAINHYSPWYSASYAGVSGSITLHALACGPNVPGLIENLGDVYLANRKAYGVVAPGTSTDAGTYWTNDCACCDYNGYEINTIKLPTVKGLRSASNSGTGESFNYWYDWDHYNAIWNGTYIEKYPEWDVPTSEVNYHSGIKESNYKDCGCGANSSRKRSIGSGVRLNHGHAIELNNNGYYSYGDYNVPDIVKLSNDVDSYMLTAGNSLVTKRPDCECNEILGWKNTSFDGCLNSSGDDINYRLTFSDGYEITAGQYARFLTHNTTQRNNVNAGVSSAQDEDAQWPYDILAPTVIEIFLNASTYITSSHTYGFIKCADLYPGTSHTTGHVFLTKIEPRLSGANTSFRNGQRFLKALGDSEYSITRAGISNLFGATVFTKQTHMTTFATSYPRSVATESIFSGCVMVENGLYVLFEDFCNITSSGCTDPSQSQYNWQASTDDGSCAYTFNNSNLFNKIHNGGHQITPATWSSTVRGDEKIYNYDTTYDAHLNGIDVWNSLNGGGNRFADVSKSIFTTDGYSTPFYARSFTYGSASYCGDNFGWDRSKYEVISPTSSDTIYVEDATDWLTDHNIYWSSSAAGIQTVCLQTSSNHTAEVAISGIEIITTAFSWNNSIILLDSVAGLRQAGILTFEGGHLVRYSGYYSGGGGYIATVVSSSMTASFLSTGTEVVSASGFWELTIDPVVSVTASTPIPWNPTDVYGTTTASLFGNHAAASSYYNDIVLNRFSASLSSSLYNSINRDLIYGDPKINFYTTSSLPFTSAPTKSIFDYSFSNTSSTNTSIDTASAYSGYNSYFTNHLKDITYLDLSNVYPPTVTINSYTDVAQLTGLKYLKIDVPQIAPTSLSFVDNTLLEHLVLDGVGDLQELDVSTNKNLQTIELLGKCEGYNEFSCSSDQSLNGGDLSKLHLTNNCSLESISLINCISTSSNLDFNFRGAGGLKDLTIIGGGLEEINIQHNKELKNITITECPLESIDVSCAGPNLETLFLANTDITALNVGMNTNLKALSLAKTPLTAALDLGAISSSLLSLSYVSCSFNTSGFFYDMTESRYLPSSLVDINVSENYWLNALDLGHCNDLETIIAEGNNLIGIFNVYASGLTLPSGSSGSLKNLSIQNSDQPIISASFFEGNDSIEMLNISNLNAGNLGYPQYFPTGAINIISNDNLFLSSSATFNSCSVLQHLEIERCDLEGLQLTAKTGMTNHSRIKHVLATENKLSAYPTNSYAVPDMTTIIVPTGSATLDNFNVELEGCPYLQILDISTQTSNSESFTFLDLQRNRDIRVINASNNIDLQAIRFVSHSVLKSGSQAPVAVGSTLDSITIDLTGCTNFDTFVVDDAASSESIMYLDSLGFITPGSDGGNNWVARIYQ